MKIKYSIKELSNYDKVHAYMLSLGYEVLEDEQGHSPKYTWQHDSIKGSYCIFRHPQEQGKKRLRVCLSKYVVTFGGSTKPAHFMHLDKPIQALMNLLSKKNLGIPKEDK